MCGGRCTVFLTSICFSWGKKYSVVGFPCALQTAIIISPKRKGCGWKFCSDIFFCFWNNIYFRLLRISLQVLSSIFISILVFSVWSFLLKVKHENIIYANITSPLSSQAFTISRKEYYLCLCMNQCFAFRILFEYKRYLVFKLLWYGLLCVHIVQFGLLQVAILIYLEPNGTCRYMNNGWLRIKNTKESKRSRWRRRCQNHHCFM